MCSIFGCLDHVSCSHTPTHTFAPSPYLRIFVHSFICSWLAALHFSTYRCRLPAECWMELNAGWTRSHRKYTKCERKNKNQRGVTHIMETNPKSNLKFLFFFAPVALYFRLRQVEANTRRSHTHTHALALAGVFVRA